MPEYRRHYVPGGTYFFTCTTHYRWPILTTDLGRRCLREAIAMVAEGICDAETVDRCVKNSFGLRLAVLGPLENADLAGLDLTLDIHETIIPELDRSPGPNPYLLDLVEQGRLGFKSGQGFMSWTNEEIAAVRKRLARHLVKALRER